MVYKAFPCNVQTLGRPRSEDLAGSYSLVHDWILLSSNHFPLPCLSLNLTFLQLPLAVAFRVMDSLLLEGIPALFRVALSILLVSTHLHFESWIGRLT